MAFTHVLVPTDPSKPANNALRSAIEEAGLPAPGPQGGRDPSAEAQTQLRDLIANAFQGRWDVEVAMGSVPGPDDQAAGRAGPGSSVAIE